MITIARKKRTAVFRQYVAAETAVPVIACAACLPVGDEKNYFFSGVARSKSVREADDGVGPKVDEFFTVSIGGMVTLLNTSGQPIHPVSSAPDSSHHPLSLRRFHVADLFPPHPLCVQGDLIEWCFYSQKGTHEGKRQRMGPRRIGINIASVSSPKVIGRALSFAKAGEQLDLLLKQ